MADKTGERKAALVKKTSLGLLISGAVAMLAPFAALADDCLDGPSQPTTLRNPLVQGAPHSQPGQIAYGGQLPPVGSGSYAPGVVRGDSRNTRVTSGYNDRSHGSFFPAAGSQGAKMPMGYVPGNGRYPTQNGYQQGMYDFGQGARYGTTTREYGAENYGQQRYEGGYGNYGQRKYDMGQGVNGQQTYDYTGGNGGTWTQDYGAGASGQNTYEGGYGNNGQRSYDQGQGIQGTPSYDNGGGNGGQWTIDSGKGASGQSTFEGGYGNQGARRMENGGGGYGTKSYESGSSNGGTGLYSGKGRSGGEKLMENGKGNNGAKQWDGGAGNGGTRTNDNGTEASGPKITNNGGAGQGARPVVNNGGTRSGSEGTQDQAFARGKIDNAYDFQGPLPTVRTFSRYLVILGVVVATIFVAMASVGVIMGNRGGPDRVIGAIGGLLLLLASYTIWKVVQMNTFKANTTGVTNNSRGQAQQRQQNDKVNPPEAFAPPQDPGETQMAPRPSQNQMDPHEKQQVPKYRPTAPAAQKMKAPVPKYRPTGPAIGHPQGPDNVGSYRIPSQGYVPEPPNNNVLNPNLYN